MSGWKCCSVGPGSGPSPERSSSDTNGRALGWRFVILRVTVCVLINTTQFHPTHVMISARADRSALSFRQDLIALDRHGL